MIGLFVLICGLVAVSATAAAGPPQGSATSADRSASAEVDELLSEIVGESDVGVAMGKLEAVERFGSYMPNEAFADKLEAAAAQVVSPLVSFGMLRAAQLSRLDAADFSHGKDGMGGQMGRQGCLTEWSLVGPFDNPSMEGFHQRLGPERGEPGPYVGKMTEVEWRDNPPYHRLCDFDLDHTVEPHTAAVVYLAGEIDAQRAGEAKLLLGAQGAFKVWLNGEPVAHRGEDLGLGIDGDAWKVELEKGKNQLLVKLGSSGDGSLGLSARLVDPQLKPIADARFSAGWDAKPVERIEADQLAPTDDGLAATAAAATEARSDASAVWAAWLWSRVEPLDAATPWRSTAEWLHDRAQQRAQNTEPVAARELAVAADLFEEHWRRLDVLELAHQLAPRNPWITVRLASEYGSSISLATRQKQRALLDELRAQRPEFLPAHLSLADWYSSSGFSEKALATLEAYTGESKMDVAAYMRRLAYLTEEVDRHDRASELYGRLEEISALSTSHAWRRASDLIARGEVDEALDLVRAQREIAPWSTRWGLREAELLRAKGDAEAGLAEIDELIKAHPGEIHLRRERAELLVALDRPVEALTAVEEAIALRPQDRSLREFRAFLQPDSARFYEPWIVEDIGEIADEHPPSSHSYDRVVDQTLIHVAPNGLSTEFTQRAERVITSEGLDSVSSHRIVYQGGDEQVEVLAVRVHKPDGTISEDYDRWYSGDSRKRSTTYNDSAYVNVRANNVDVGDIVEFRYRVSEIANENFRGDYFGDVSYLQSTRPIALQRYAVHYPKSWELSFRPPTLEHTKLRDELPGGEKLDDGYRLTGFEMRDVPAVDTDSGQPGYADVYDYVMVSNKQTYDQIGRWWWNLIKEQLIVDDTIRQKVAELTDGLDTDEQKLQAIHNYVVKNTRYLHVGLGIHGWKPYRTTTCFRNRYGDCKDKAALLKVMLDEAGIPAKMVLVRTRRLGSVDDFPAAIHIFNHAITYVPGMDLYLDGTAEYNGTTELTPMDQGAQGLVVDDGGKARMVTLPVDEPRDNLLRQELSVDLSGDAPIAEGRLVARGQNAVYYRRNLEDAERRDEALEQQLASVYSGAELISADYRNLDELEKPVEITYKFRGGRLARESRGSKFVYPYGAPKDLLSAYAKNASRTQDLTIRLPFENHTTIRYRLAADESFERIPEPTRLETKFGSLDIG
ncbi:MAG: DUF3857 domain-containing protein, partial [Persicimonas sp.]